MSQADELYRLGPVLARVLNIAKEVARQLHISRFNPRTVTLVERAPPDTCYFTGRHHRQLRVQSTAVERLDPEDWRPLIASSLIYSKSFRKLFVETLVVLVMMAATISLFGDWRANLVLVILVVIVSAGISQLTTLQGKKNQLKADKKAEQLLGKGSLLQVLKKVEATSPEYPRKRFFTIPTIKERIGHLTSNVELPNSP